MFSFLLIACSIHCSVANYCVLGTLPIVLGDKPEDLKSFDEVLNIRGLCVLIWIKEFLGYKPEDQKPSQHVFHINENIVMMLLGFTKVSF
ncbi:hypothetical protein P8452_04052 [Trifolium repens]|nr:hypothetical protein P8452_04052 [Trifolium repens]